LRRREDGLVHFLAGHRLPEPVRSVEPNTTCPGCDERVYRFVKKDGEMSACFKRDGEPHWCFRLPEKYNPDEAVEEFLRKGGFYRAQNGHKRERGRR